MQHERIRPAHRIQRAIVLGLFALWGVASMITLGYQQSANPADNAQLPNMRSNTK